MTRASSPHALRGLPTWVFAGGSPTELIDRCELSTGHYGQPRVGVDMSNDLRLRLECAANLPRFVRLHFACAVHRG